ncbi:transmembrane amino acid transporter protein-domain-containing protein [Gautieria morchelliformis]|nr:transmembrane amino acid transporter protein-domain-containing protein [Gautieria morchelliformis]
MAATLPVDFPTSVSPASSTRFGDIVASYRRAQTFLSGSNITTHDAFPDYLERRDEERDAAREYEDSIEITAAIEPRDELNISCISPFVEPLWDEEFQPSSMPNASSITNEQTPLLTGRRASCRELPHPQTIPEHRKPAVTRRLSQRALDREYHRGGNSTYRQTLFNSTAILLGIGMLSEPLAFAYAGWAMGTVLIVLYGFITCYTAKILARIIAVDPTLRTYADIGQKAFGRRSTMFTGLLFCLEVFAVSVVLVTLYGDSMHLVMPGFSSTQYKFFGLLIIIPTVFMPLSVLSYASILGILSTILIIACIFIDGLSKHEAPGSLWQPAATDWGVKDANKLGVAFGLFMAGFGGHGVIPSLARDMIDPSWFDHMINRAFAVATVIYGMIGGAGYLMFGKTVSEEVTNDILATPGYNDFLNKLAVWMLVLATLTKFALCTRPLNVTLEIWFGIDKPPLRSVSPTTKSTAALATSINRPFMLFVERVALVLLAASVSVLVPEFSTVMAILGSFSTFVLCVIWPICAKAAIQGRCSWYDGILLGMSAVFTVWGTIAAFG